MAGHTSQVLSLGFTADGQRLISSSADETIRLWNLATGDCTAVLRGHQHGVWSLAQSAADNVLLSSSQDETIKAWDLTTGAHFKTLRCARPYEGSRITGATGLTEAQRVSLQALGAMDEIETRETS